ncbi:MAG: hypothetical protein GF353_26000 [Candidatus Lokiarchaeota archaeon]|nr:hypothetical protein [Candidatus Lokiarchaeota archaeon]
MEKSKENLDIIREEIGKIKEAILAGEINLLETELVPIFNKLRKTVNVNNIGQHSKSYKESCEILDQKFKEFKKLLYSTSSEAIFRNFLELNPKDKEIAELINSCWYNPFIIRNLSFVYLEDSAKLLAQTTYSPITIKHVEKTTTDDDFLLEIPEQKFTEKMTDFYEKISEKLPCSYDDIFADYNDQLRLFEDFVYFLHLLQLGKIKYQKETRTIYK